MKNFLFQKKIQVWDQSTNQIPHLYFFFEMKIFSFQKNLQVLNQPLVIFFRKSLGHSQDLYMDTAIAFKIEFFTTDH